MEFVRRGECDPRDASDWNYWSGICVSGPVTKGSRVSFSKWRGFVMNRTMAVGFLILIVGHVGVATAQDRKFVDKLVESRLQLKIDGERMTGGGADLLRSALDGAQYVLIGEDHATSQIPAFTSAVCAILGPQGFHTMAVEAGPMAAGIVPPRIGGDDRRDESA